MKQYFLKASYFLPVFLAGSLISPAQAVSLFTPGNLVVSTSTYVGNASTVTIGQTLPGGGTAIANGTYPGVFNNATPDASFGVTSPIILEQLTTSGTVVGTPLNVTDLAAQSGQGLVTSFPSKSEESLNLTPDGTGLTFIDYASTVNKLDISNSNTPAIIEPGNPVTATPTFREVAQLGYDGSLQLTTTNAYSGNNGRAAILANGLYYTVGNAGNGNGSAAVTSATGVQIVVPGQNASSSTAGTNPVGSFNITQVGYPADKTAKDNNFRGETIYNNTLYVTKGSGGNGIDTVYQVGNAGSLPTLANAANAPITILPGFPTNLAKSTATVANPVYHPFGLFFANPNTLYVADEGDGVLANAATGSFGTAGLEKWSLVNGTWQLDYTLQNGLNLGLNYTVSGTDASGSSGSYTAATDGLRTLTGKVNADGTVSLYAITSTVSSSGDQGADPNKLVSITDTLAAVTSAQAVGESFTTLQTAAYGQVLRGVSFAPQATAVPESPQGILLSSVLVSIGFVAFKKKHKI